MVQQQYDLFDQAGEIDAAAIVNFFLSRRIQEAREVHSSSGTLAWEPP
jgi:uncharacterized protein (DUF1778 family)